MSLSPSVRRSLVGKREFFRMIPPSQDLSILFQASHSTWRSIKIITASLTPRVVTSVTASASEISAAASTETSTASASASTSNRGVKVIPLVSFWRLIVRVIGIVNLDSLSRTSEGKTSHFIDGNSSSLDAFVLNDSLMVSGLVVNFSHGSESVEFSFDQFSRAPVTQPSEPNSAGLVNFSIADLTLELADVLARELPLGGGGHI